MAAQTNNYQIDGAEARIHQALFKSKQEILSSLAECNRAVNSLNILLDEVEEAER